jgi:hypothetical protein
VAGRGLDRDLGVSGPRSEFVGHMLPWEQRNSTVARTSTELPRATF